MKKRNLAVQHFDDVDELGPSSILKPANPSIKTSHQPDFATLIESLGEGILYCDREDIVLHLNSRMAEISGYTQEEMIGKIAYELLLPPEEYTTLRNRTLRRLEGVAERYEILLMKKDRTRFWAEINATPIRDSKGVIIGTLGAITDISERKRVAEELRYQKEYLRQVIDTSPNLIFSKDVNGRFSLVNKAFADSYGIPAEQILGKKDVDIHPDPDEVAIFVSDCQEVLETGQTKLIAEQKMHSPITGKPQWFQTIRKPLLLPDSSTLQVLSVATDITERKTAELEAIRLQRQLLQAQKMEAIGQLAAGVAHDLNNALAAVVGHLQLLELDPNLSDTATESVTIAYQGCERALSLIEQLLGFSRQGKYDLKVVRASTIINETLDFLSKVIGTNITIERPEDPENVLVRGDIGQLQQALINLIINAKQSMPDGGTISFSISSRSIEDPSLFNSKATPGEYVALSVSDTGIGIPSEQIHKVFDPFFTTKSGGKGSGLGLSMVYGILQNHGGWVTVDSELGVGSTFTLFLPRTRLPEDKPNQKQTDVITRSLGKILVIDDEMVLLELTRRFLELAGLESIGFSSGRSATAWYNDHFHEVDLVILDMKMAEMDGTACFHALREVNPDAQVVILSGYVQDQAAQALMAKGALRFFQKPLKYKDLIKWISKFLENRSQKLRIS